MEELSKKERKQLIRQEQDAQRTAEEKKEKTKKLMIRGGILLVLVILGYWGMKELMKPLPGTLYPDLGRDHVNDISEITYNSDPPTSGTHFPAWAKKGVYDRVVSDGYLLHSLEHGYIVISYDCEASAKFKVQSSKLQFKIKNVFAQESETIDAPVDENAEDEGSGKPLTKMTVFPTDQKSWITPEEQPGIEIELSAEFSSDSCKSLVSDLKPFTDEWDRVIVVPRTGMDKPIALTAWRRLLTLDSVDNGAIEDFIQAFHNRGPEQTME